MRFAGTAYFLIVESQQVMANSRKMSMNHSFWQDFLTLFSFVSSFKEICEKLQKSSQNLVVLKRGRWCAFAFVFQAAYEHPANRARIRAAQAVIRFHSCFPAGRVRRSSELRARRERFDVPGILRVGEPIRAFSDRRLTASGPACEHLFLSSA